MRLRKVLVVLLVAFLMSGLLAGCGGNDEKDKQGDSADKQEKIKVGWVYIGVPGDAGWTFAHDEGRKYMESQIPGVESIVLENVPEGADAERSFEQLAQEGCKIIFGTSFGYGDAMLAVAKKYPDVKFMHASGFYTNENMSNYFGRIYQARYLSGMVAGAMTKTNKIGYVAAYTIPEVVRGINAFTLGVQAVNPDAVVKVVKTNTWYDPTVEKQSAQALLADGCDVIAQHQDTPQPQIAAEEAGKFGIGYNTDMKQWAPEANLTSPIWNWGPYYTKIVQSVIDGTWKSESYWGGLADGIVDLAPISDKVPSDIIKQVEAKKELMIKGEWDVFNGPIYAQDGTLKVKEGQDLSDADKLSMDWFVKGVEGTID
jgi:basic membrane protein A